MHKSLLLSFFLTIFLLSFSSIASEKVGILFSSYGDIDAKNEIENLVKNTLGDPDIVPIPRILVPLLYRLGWDIKKEGIFEEYEAIGGITNMRLNSKKQATLVAQKMRTKGLDVTAYTGFTKTFPYVAETLEQIRKDGIKRLVVFYQGAQYSKVTAYIVFRDIMRYLDKHPNWDIQVIGVRSFSNDYRFIKLLADDIEKLAAEKFQANFNEKGQTCLFLPVHGNIMKWVKDGDPYLGQVIRVKNALTKRFPNFNVQMGFQNHDELPMTKWTKPGADTVAENIGKDSCPNVIIDGRVSFTVDSLETLFDHAINERGIIQDMDRTKNIAVQKMFNDHDGFAEYLKNIAFESLEGKGDIEYLR
jgi:ferrochelatase